jgi:hypothetical protein
MFDVTPLLLHSDEVPEPVKEALLAAGAASGPERQALLEAAARELYWETPLGCADARELVGLPSERSI